MFAKSEKIVHTARQRDTFATVNIATRLNDPINNIRSDEILIKINIFCYIRKIPGTYGNMIHVHALFLTSRVPGLRPGETTTPKEIPMVFNFNLHLLIF